MNLWKVSALVLAVVVLLASVLTATDNPMAFFDIHGILVVMGGTLSATAISFQIPKIFVMLKIFWRRSVLGRDVDYTMTIRSVIDIAQAYAGESSEIRAIVSRSNDDFVKEAFTALVDGVAETGALHRMLRRRSDTIFERYMQDAQRFRAIGKYPPAMGLLGAVTGMIALLSSLGQPGVEKTIGPAMSMALVATMYGIAFANFFILPVADSLAEHAKEIRVKNLIVCEAVRLATLGMNSLQMAEELNSYLLPGQRVQWNKAG
jgi:chemotaxis protein MotA